MQIGRRGAEMRINREWGITELGFLGAAELDAAGQSDRRKADVHLRTSSACVHNSLASSTSPTSSPDKSNGEMRSP